MCNEPFVVEAAPTVSTRVAPLEALKPSRGNGAPNPTLIKARRATGYKIDIIRIKDQI